MLPEWIALLPRWLTVGLLSGAVLSVLIAGVFLLGGRLSPAAPDPSTRVDGGDRRANEIGRFLEAIGEQFLTDHPVRGERVAFYLPRRDVAITFDPQAYFRLTETPTHAVLCEHEMPGAHLGRRLPFETPDVGGGTRDGERLDGQRLDRPVEAAFRRLGLPPDADAEAVTDAYRDRIKQVHPDHGGDPERFHRVREAYDTAREHAE